MVDGNSIDRGVPQFFIKLDGRCDEGRLSWSIFIFIVVINNFSKNIAIIFIVVYNEVENEKEGSGCD